MSLRPWGRRRCGCVPWPALLVRIGVVVLVLVFVLVLLRWGYDPQTCLLLVSGAVMAAVHVSERESLAPRRAWPPSSITSA